jgi:3-hydroxybutyrate dehydrogenase
MLKGKTALVTGSTRGLGEATASALAAEGCNVMLSGFGDAAQIENKRGALAEEHNVSVGYHDADLADPAQIENLMRRTRDDLGGPDILVNNAVIRYFHEVDEFPREQWDNALAVNVSAPFHLIKLALPGMRKRDWGRIVNISSVMGLGGRSGRADYITSKSALIGMTRAVASETRMTENITCNALCPGTILTPNTEIKIAELAEAEGLGTEEARRQYLLRRSQPTDFIDPARVARLIVFLCQDKSYDITGAIIPIDSGRSATWLEAPMPG